MSKETEVQWCTRCPKVGRTGNDRGIRDTAHYYCRDCRREYQKDRYASSSPDILILEQLEEAQSLLEQVLYAEKAVEQEHKWKVDSSLSIIKRTLAMIAGKPMVQRTLLAREGSEMDPVEPKKPLQDYLSIFWGANSVDNIVLCNKMIAEISRHYPEATELVLLRKIMASPRN